MLCEEERIGWRSVFVFSSCFSFVDLMVLINGDVGFNLQFLIIKRCTNHILIRREKEPSRRLIFVQYSLFVFWLRADGGLAFCRAYLNFHFVAHFRILVGIFAVLFQFYFML